MLTSTPFENQAVLSLCPAEGCDAHPVGAQTVYQVSAAEVPPPLGSRVRVIRFIVATAPGNWPGAGVERRPSEPLGAGGETPRRGARGPRGAGTPGAGGRAAGRPAEERPARGMGCGPSQPAQGQRGVPAPRKGWEEGVKVNHGKDRKAVAALGGGCGEAGVGGGRVGWAHSDGRRGARRGGRAGSGLLSPCLHAGVANGDSCCHRTSFASLLCFRS